METEQTNELLEQIAQVIDESFEEHERNAASDLLCHLNVLPWELQDKYWEYLELYRARKWAEASQAWEEWLQQARDMDLL